MTYLIITQPGGFSPGDSPHLAPHLKTIFELPCYAMLWAPLTCHRGHWSFILSGDATTQLEKNTKPDFSTQKTPFLRQCCPAKNMLTCHTGLCSRPLPTLASHSICTSCPGNGRDVNKPNIFVKRIGCGFHSIHTSNLKIVTHCYLQRPTRGICLWASVEEPWQWHWKVKVWLCLWWWWWWQWWWWWW